MTTHLKATVRAKQKGQSHDWPSYLKVVHPERFERPTTWFVARYSIQLSYGRLVLKTGRILRVDEKHVQCF